MEFKTVKFLTADIDRQQYFYGSILGFKTRLINKENLLVEAGSTNLIFTYSPSFTPYHFAFNIPKNKSVEALNWLKSRVDLLKDEETELIYFDNWKANAMYFYDSDGNIAEFIARYTLNDTSDKPFGIESVRKVSEIGLGVTDIETVYKHLNQLCGLEIYFGGFERFCAIGNEYGLFITVDKDKKKWFPTDDKVEVSDFEVEFNVINHLFKAKFSNGHLTVKPMV